MVFKTIKREMSTKTELNTFLSKQSMLIYLGRPYDIDFVHNTALDGTIYEGASVTFTCSAKGNPPIDDYKFLHNGKEIHKSSNGKYFISEVRLKNSGMYCCIPVNKAGLGENKTVVLNVKGQLASDYLIFIAIEL